MALGTDVSGLGPLFLFLGILIFALLGWCIVSSCMGRSIMGALSELWEMSVLSARSQGQTAGWRRRRAWNDELDDFEMEHRSRAL